MTCVPWNEVRMTPGGNFSPMLVMTRANATSWLRMLRTSALRVALDAVPAPPEVAGPCVW